jgi:hypothetical protein
MASSTYNYPGYTMITPNDAYFIAYGNTDTGGGNMIIATGLNNDIIFTTGGVDTVNEVARFKDGTGLVLKNLPITFADTTTQNTAAAPYAYSTSAYNFANNTFTYATAGFNKANDANVLAQSSYDFANTVNTYSVSAYSYANATNTLTISAYNKANDANVLAQSAYDSGNNTATYATAGFNKANAANVLAQSAYDSGNATYTYATAGFNKANSANVLSQSVYDFANTVNTYSFSAYAYANVTNTLTVSAYNKANAANVLAQSAYDSGNSTNTLTVASYNKANAANVLAQSAYDYANGTNALAVSAYNKANGAVQTAFVTVSANGNSITPSSNNDTLTITAATANGINVLNPSSKTIDLGLRNSGVTSGNYGGSTQIPVLAVDAFGRITSASNVAVSTTINLSANNGSGSVSGGGTLTVIGNTGISTTTTGSKIYIDNTGVTSLATGSSSRVTVSSSTGASTIDLATVPTVLGGSYSYPALTVDSYGRVTVISNQTPVVSFSGGSTGLTPSSATNGAITLSGTLGIGNGGTNNTSYTSGQIIYYDGTKMSSLANSGVTAGSYGNTTNIPSITVDAYGRVTAVSNTTISIPSGTTIVANTGQLTANASTGIVALGLATTAVSAGTYGNTTFIPSITIDSYGRVTSVSNVVAAAATSSIVTNVDKFVANGTGNTFVLSATPYSANSTIVNINGTVQLKSTYSLLNNTITLASTPANGANVEITTFFNAANTSATVSALSSNLDTFTGDGSTSNFTLSTVPSNKNYTFVNIDGVQQQRSTYSLSSSTITFTTPPPNASQIEVVSLVGSTGVLVGLNSYGAANNAVYSTSASTITAGTLPITAGGTSATSYTSGQIIYYDGSKLSSLANSGVTAGSYGNTSSIPAITVDAYGRVTSISNTAISIPAGTTIVANTGQLTANASTGVVALGLATTSVTAGTYGSSSNVASITVDSYGRITSVSNVSVSGSSSSLVEPFLAPTISGGVLTLNMASTSLFNVALNANISSIVLSNVPSAANQAVNLVLVFTADGTARTVSWPSSFKWPNNVAPTPTSTNGKRDMFSFISFDAGTTWLAIVSGQNF